MSRGRGRGPTRAAAGAATGRPRRPGRAIALGLVCLVALAPGRPAVGESLSPAQARGKQIYLQGTSASGRPVRAFVREGQMVPASALPCVGCHGRDGRGRPEAGLVPADISWAELSKPYDHVHPSGRRHPPYTRGALARTVRYGADPAGHRLDPSKPVYDMAEADLADLLAYLEVLGREPTPGVTRRSIALGAVLPSAGPMAAAAAAVGATLEAHLADVNAGGGVYARRLELRVAGTVDEAAADVLALLAPVVAGAERQLAATAERERIPVIGPLSLFPPVGLPGAGTVFSVFPGVVELALALVDAGARARGSAGEVAVVTPTWPELEAVSAAVEEQARRRGAPEVRRLDYPGGALDAERVVARLAERGTDLVVFLGSAGEGTALLREVARAGLGTMILVPAPLLGAGTLDVAPALAGRVLLGYPPGPSSLSPAAAADFAAFAARHRLPGHHPALQVAAWTVSRLLVEALKVAGRDVTREGLITALEGFRDLDLGLAWRVAFGPNRRVALRGAWVVDAAPRPEGRGAAPAWVTLEE